MYLSLYILNNITYIILNTLKRELFEELGVEIDSLTYYK